MTFDYGQRAKPKLRGPAIAALAVGILVCAGIAAAVIAGSVLNDRAHERADQATYGPTGAPCPAGTPAGMAAAGVKPRHSFDYDDLLLSYAFGGADCAEIAGKGGLFGIGAPHIPVCRFTSPGGVEVRAGARDLLFAPGIGQPAAIVEQDHAVRCIMTARELG